MPFRKTADLPSRCPHPEHQMPGHQHLSPGRYEYECPGCGKTTSFTLGRLQTWEQAEPIQEIPTP